MAALLAYFLIQLLVGALVVIGIVLVARSSGHAHPATSFATAGLKPVLLLLMLPISCGLSIGLFRAWFRRQWSLRGTFGMGRQPVRTEVFALHVLLGLGVAIAGGLLTLLLTHGKAPAQDIARIIQSAPMPIRLGIGVMAVAVVPVAEELLFRGILLPALMRHAPVAVAIGLDATLFALVHLPDLGWKPQGLLALALVGVVCCWRRLKTGSIYSAMAVHAGNNLLAVLALILRH